MKRHKQIKAIFTPEEYEALIEAKQGLTWEQFILTLITPKEVKNNDNNLPT